MASSFPASAQGEIDPPAVKVEGTGEETPVRRISSNELKQLGQNLDKLFRQYGADRRIAELRWLRNQRQYLGIYDPEVEKELSANRSKAYPRITRVKCISVLSRLMNLMFPGNEKNWELKASPSPSMEVKDVQQAVQDAMQRDQDAGIQPQVDNDYIMSAVQELANQRADQLSLLIDDQLQELGGDQTYDYIALNRKVVQSGILYGLGVLRGPYAREEESTVWTIDPQTRQPAPKTKTIYKPLFEFLPIWDFYPDMSAKTFTQMDGYFTRVVMSRAQVRRLADRPDFFADQIKEYLNKHAVGNYRPQLHEIELRAMGVKVNVNEMKSETMKYEVIVWHGPVSGQYLSLAGVDVPEDKMADDIDAEIWMIDSNVIKADMNPWRAMGVDAKTIHTFLFDEDDTSPVGFGLPNAIRDSQMAISAATRMLLDNASVVCGPNIELNTDLLRADQDLTSVSAYKIWYREGLGADANMPAVRNVPIDSHMNELLKTIDLFMKFADLETFVGPATGGDMEKGPSEPFRTAAGASMLRGDAALPFKDIVRHFDQFTQSVIDSLVKFNRKFNPDQAPEGDYDVIARGATSLIAKEIRGIQVDQLAVSLRPEEMVHVDERKLVEARFKVRDLGDLLVSEEEAARRQKAQGDAQAAQQKQAEELAEANVRKLLSDAFKNIAQGNKNSANADAVTVKAALDVLEKGLTPSEDGSSQNPTAPAGPAAPAASLGGGQGGLGLAGPVAGRG
jgi:hypothetical protein